MDAMGTKDKGYVALMRPQRFRKARRTPAKLRAVMRRAVTPRAARASRGPGGNDSLFPPNCRRGGKRESNGKATGLSNPGLGTQEAQSLGLTVQASCGSATVADSSLDNPSVPRTQANEQWMKGVADEGPLTSQTLWRLGLKDLLDGLELVDKQVAAMTRYLDGYLAKQAGWPWLQSIPGVGPRTAEAVLAHTDDVRRFGRGKEYGAYFGLTPKLDESGDSRRIGYISKQGPSVVRGLLVESAWRAIQSSEALRMFYERVRAGQSSRRKIAIVAVARKMAVIMRSMLLAG